MPTTIQLDRSMAQSLATALFEFRSHAEVVANLFQAAAAPGGEDNTDDTGHGINESIIAPTVNVDNNTAASNTAEEEYHFNITTDEGRLTFDLSDNYAHVENGPKGLLDGKPVSACIYPVGNLPQNREALPRHWHVQTITKEAIYLHNCEWCDKHLIIYSFCTILTIYSSQLLPNWCLHSTLLHPNSSD